MILLKKTVFFILLTTICFNTIGMAIYTYIPPYLEFLKFQKPVIQLVSSIFPLTSFLFPIVLGKISDKIQNRLIFIISGTIGISATLLLLIFTKEIIWIIIFLFLYGFFSSCYRLIFVLYQELVENNSKFISYYNGMITLGWFLGAQLGGIFIEIFGILNIFFFLLIFSIINIVLLIFIKEDRQLILDHYNTTSNLKLNDNNEQERGKSISKSIYYALFFRNYGVRPVMAILAILMTNYLTSDSQIGFLIGVNPLIQFFLMFLIANYIKEKNEKKLMVIGYLLSAVTLFGYIISIDLYGFLFFQILVSFSYAMFWNATQIYIAQRTTPQNKGKYIGYANSSFYLGSFIGGLFFGSLLSFNSNYYYSIWFMIIFPVISATIILFKFNKEEGSLRRTPK